MIGADVTHHGPETWVLRDRTTEVTPETSGLDLIETNLFSSVWN